MFVAPKPIGRDECDRNEAMRSLKVEDCATVVEFLATDLSDYVTGEVIPIDGRLVRGKSGGRAGHLLAARVHRDHAAPIQEIYISPIQRARTRGL
jgi:NAD(P)-dependent dehydrogenase (short-subunit alcohol dehydrogenase family)